MASPQTLSETDRRVVSAWAADCAAHVLGYFEADMPGDDRPRQPIERARAYARGESTTAEEIRRRFQGGVPGEQIASPAAGAAARAAGQAAAVAHMGAHALGAAAYAVEAVASGAPDRPGAIAEEVKWQLDQMTPAVRAALGMLPTVGTNRSGPLGPGLLTAGLRGGFIAQLQAGIAQNEFQAPHPSI